MQFEHRNWVDRNFGMNRDQDDPLLGLIEELGELSHSHLKLKQGIRVEEDHETKGKDAVGDIFLYLMDYCNLKEWDLESIIIDTLKEVHKRDWLQNKKDGVSQ